MVKERTERGIEQKGDVKAGQLEVTYYTDPLCCWSWAMEPQLRKLRFEFDGAISWHYCMGGLIPAWKNYNDEINSVTRPIQMGPVWMHAQQVSGMPMNSTIWMSNPPSSSYPSCIAVKCVEMQSTDAAQRYLRVIREALMLEGKNIAKQDVLVELATDLFKEPASRLNIAKFITDLENDNGIEAFRKDLQEIKYRGITRFPTMILKAPGHDGVIITGYRPYQSLLDTVMYVAPHLQKTNPHINECNYKNFWGLVTNREMQEITG